MSLALPHCTKPGRPSTVIGLFIETHLLHYRPPRSVSSRQDHEIQDPRRILNCKPPVYAVVSLPCQNKSPLTVDKNDRHAAVWVIWGAFRHDGDFDKIVVNEHNKQSGWQMSYSSQGESKSASAELVANSFVGSPPVHLGKDRQGGTCCSREKA